MHDVRTRPLWAYRVKTASANAPTQTDSVLEGTPITTAEFPLVRPPRFEDDVLSAAVLVDDVAPTLVFSVTMGIEKDDEGEEPTSEVPAEVDVEPVPDAPAELEVEADAPPEVGNPVRDELNVTPTSAQRTLASANAVARSAEEHEDSKHCVTELINCWLLQRQV